MLSLPVGYRSTINLPVTVVVSGRKYLPHWHRNVPGTCGGCSRGPWSARSEPWEIGGGAVRWSSSHCGESKVTIASQMIMADRWLRIADHSKIYRWLFRKMFWSLNLKWFGTNPYATSGKWFVFDNQKGQLSSTKLFVAWVRCPCHHSIFSEEQLQFLRVSQLLMNFHTGEASINPEDETKNRLAIDCEHGLDQRFKHLDWMFSRMSRRKYHPVSKQRSAWRGPASPVLRARARWKLPEIRAASGHLPVGRCDGINGRTLNRPLKLRL